MSREVHVRFWESAAVQSRRATQLPLYRQESIVEKAKEIEAWLDSVAQTYNIVPVPFTKRTAV